MARFIYRMQSILDIKTKMEEQAKMEFAAARMRLDEEEEKQRVLEERKNAYEEKGRMLRRDSLKVPEIMENRDAMARMDEFIALQQKNVEKAQQQLEEARVSLQMAMQESKTQELKKDKLKSSTRNLVLIMKNNVINSHFFYYYMLTIN